MLSRSLPRTAPRRRLQGKRLLLFVGCLTSQQDASVSQGRISSDKFTCCHTEIEAQIKLSTSPSHSILSQRWPYNARHLAGEPLECQFLSHWYDWTRKNPVASEIRTPGLPLLRQMPYPLDLRGGSGEEDQSVTKGDVEANSWRRPENYVGSLQSSSAEPKLLCHHPACCNAWRGWPPHRPSG